MFDPETFAQRQMELTPEFAKYVLDHPNGNRTLNRLKAGKDLF